MAGCFLGVLGHKVFEFSFGVLMLKVSLTRTLKHATEFRPGIGFAHVNDLRRFDPRAWRLESKQSRWLAALNATPELLFRRQKDVLLKRVGRDGDLHPSSASGNDRERRRLGICDPHVVLELWHVFLGRGILRK